MRHQHHQDTCQKLHRSRNLTHRCHRAGESHHHQQQSGRPTCTEQNQSLPTPALTDRQASPLFLTPTIRTPPIRNSAISRHPSRALPLLPRQQPLCSGPHNSHIHISKLRCIQLPTTTTPGTGSPFIHDCEAVETHRFVEF